MKLSAIGYTEGFCIRPRIDRETLANTPGPVLLAHSLTALSLCFLVATGLDPAVSSNWSHHGGVQGLVVPG